MIGKPEKVKYVEKPVASDSEIDAKTAEEITEFLETFFKLYPTASEKELEYYVENDVMRPINSNLKFVELVNPIYTQNEKSIQVRVDVKYLDTLSKVTNYFQYELELQNDGNWRIIVSE